MNAVGRAAALRRELAAADRIPYAAHVAPHVVRTAFGDYLQTFRLGGAAFESGDLSRIAEALGDVARARGMTKIAKATGLAREQLYKTLSAEGKPELSTVLKVMAAFGGGLKSNFPVSRSGSGGTHRKAVIRTAKGRRAA